IEKLTKDQVVKIAAQFLKPANRTLGMFIPTKEPVRSPMPAQPDVVAVVNHYQGHAAPAEGEPFDPSIDNIEKRTTRTTLKGGIKLAMLPKSTRGQSVKATITLHFGSEKDFKGTSEAAAMISSLLLRGSKKHDYQHLRDEFDRLKAQVSVG